MHGKFVPLQETVPPSPLLGAAGLVYIQEERGVGPDVSGVKKDMLRGISLHAAGVGEAIPST